MNNNIINFIMQAVVALMIMNIGLGAIFCMMVGNVTYFMPFVIVGLVIIAMHCFGIAVLNTVQ